MSGSNSPGSSSPPGSSRPLNRPRPARVRMGAGGTPHTVDGRRVEHVRESWLVEDRWWTGRPLRRRYWEVVSAGGRNLVVFHDLCTGEWYGQAG
ncbi:MAG TPA: hypothetical protein VNV42_09160 [Solirubrobacteraceae bacterium]|jgi:hypothetical protein|nr:hypothetical protein [Solirubrobacteraceae bacterium]